MKRTLALILSAFLLLGMIPSTFLTAIAAGPGVMSNGFQNQSQNTAKNPNILETVIIDGTVEIGITGMAIANAVLSDTGDVYGTDFKNLMRAMVAYYYYTAEYAKTVQ